MIRIYGHSFGEGSFTQVTRGFRRAAESLGLLAGFVTIDAHMEEDPPGGSAPVAISLGAPSQVALATRLGVHKQRWLMLAPNSDRIPANMVKWLPDYITGLLSPSAWGAEVLRRHFDLPVKVCPHGVGEHFRPELRDRAFEYRRKMGAGYRYAVLHMTSTNAERKGTRELLDAWQQFVKGMPEARLIVVAPHEGLAEQAFWVRRRALDETVKVLAAGALGAGRSLAAQMASFDLVCQPSRAEGFGLVPLEARALGVPVAATFCTGHSEHFPQQSLAAESAGCVSIASGIDAPVDDLPNALAPSVDPAAILAALKWAFVHQGFLEIRARANAQAIVDEWSWEKKTGPVLKELADEA